MIIIYGDIVVDQISYTALYPDDALYPDENLFPVERTIGNYLYIKSDVETSNLTVCQNIVVEEN